MRKSYLQYLLSPKFPTQGLLRRWIEETGARCWVKDEKGVIVFGNESGTPEKKLPILRSGEPIGFVCGDEKIDWAADWLSAQIDLEGEKKELGREMLHLYREVNLMYGFAEKMASVVGLEPIAAIALEEAGRLISFDQGAIFCTPETATPMEMLAFRGDNSNPETLKKRSFLDGYSGIDRGDPSGESWMLTASLQVNARVLGAIVLHRSGVEFSAGELKLAISLGLQTAAALENAIRYEEVTTRSVELQREKLEKEKLSELAEMKERFYANITHEFRTPLTVILGMTQLPDKDLPEAIRDRLDMIHRNGKSMLGLVDQLLDLAKLETDAMELKLLRTDIIAFLRQLMEPFYLYAAERELTLEMNSTMDQLSMAFDPDKVRQILTNLISNALKFTPPGGQIHLHVNRPQDQPDRLVMTLSDTGPGIPSEDLPRIFDRFYQSEHDVYRPHPGSGIGLAHAREMAGLMGGNITVESSLGEGTTFTCWIPVTEAEETAPIEPVRSKPIVAPIKGENPLLLLIEDNADLNQYLQTALQNSYQVEVAQDGQEGLEKAKILVPDIIISDVMLPGADGFEICQTLKTNPLTSHIPIILLTARADDASRLKGLRQGADAYLSKPFDLEELLIRLEKMLDLRSRLQVHYSALALEGGTASEEEPDIEDAFIVKLKAILEENISDENFALPNLCQAIGMSRSQLFRKLKALINEAPSTFIRKYRLHRARQLLEAGGMQVSEVAYQVGFKDPAYFSYAFSEMFGITPRSVRERRKLS